MYAIVNDDSIPEGFVDLSVFAADFDRETAEHLNEWLVRYVGQVTQEWHHVRTGKYPHEAFCVWFKHSKHKTLFDLAWGDKLTMIPVRQE